MSVSEQFDVLTENERITITAHGIKLTEVSRLIPMKVAMHRLNKHDWMQVANNIEASNVFWSSLRDELMKYVAEKSMSQSMAAKCKTTRDQLLFYLLFTTGLRASGLAKIKVDQVAAYDNCWTVQTFGKTVEKGNKIRTFPLNNKVKQFMVIVRKKEY